MATPNIVPIADTQGGLGTAAKSWGKLFINQAASQSTPAVTLDNQTVDQVALDINANNTTANVLDINAQALTTGNALFIDANSLTSGTAINIDVDDALEGTSVKKLFYLDYDKSGVTGDGENAVNTGLYVSLNDAATNHASGTSYLIGAQIDVTHQNAQGSVAKKGLILNVGADSVGDAASTWGIDMEVLDGGTDYRQLSSADSNDYFTMATTTNGATTLTTVDGSAAAAHISILPDGLLITPDKVPTLSAITDCAITLVAGTEYVVNDANGGAMVLPAAAVGSRITINIGTLITSNTITITAASGDLLKGYAFMEATDAANNKTYFAPDGSDDLIITLDGSTTGGLIGDKIELVGISPTEWRVRATLSHTGSAATPFS